MKVKLLSYMIASFMAGMTPSVWADIHSENPASSKDHDASTGCQSDQCFEDGKLLFRLASQSYDEPVSQGTSKKSSANELSTDRRVTLSVASEAVPGIAKVKGNFYAELPHGGVVWATEDPSPGRAELTVSGPAVVPFFNGKISKPVTFFTRSNYSAFIDRMELLVFKSSDTDYVTPLAKIPLRVGAVTDTEWDGQLSAAYQYREGDQLIYIVRAYGQNGQFDETYQSQFQLVSPEEEQRNNTLLRNNLEKSMNTALNAQDAVQQSLINEVFAGNGLRQQNILFHGSKIRVQGRNISSNSRLEINGQTYPVDQEGKFVAEYLMPVGQHQFNIRVDDGQNKVEKTLPINVTGKYFFATAIADVTVQEQKINGSNEIAANANRDDDILTDARLAFYVKSKIKAKYLITAQADTTERDIKELFTGFTDSYPEDVFRRLDPDQYYPTYGDDSTTTRDVDTQGRMYLRVDWDKSQALWGNYSTSFSGTELAQYQRSLYGGALDWRSNSSTIYGDEKTRIRLFGSDANTAHGHTELQGTGGSLYYLRHTDIIPGSDNVVLEVRDKTTGRTISTRQLISGADYEFDAYQGRIITRRPLSQIANEDRNSITIETPLDGYEQRLLVDYEYSPQGLDDQLTMGVRAKHWLNDHIGIGATYVDEQNSGDDYKLKAADLTLKAGRGTYLKVEHGQSEATSVPVFFSDNGGLSFVQLTSNIPRDGKATSVEARVNLKEQGLTKHDWSAGAWWRNLDAGYSSARTDFLGQEITEYGAEVLGELKPDLNLYSKHSRAERGNESLTQNQLTTEWRLNDEQTLTAELKHVDEQRLNGDAAGTLAAVKYSQRITPSLEMYGTGQVTLDKQDLYTSNDAVTIGGRYLFGNQSSVSAAATSGSRGNSATVSGEHQLTAEHSLYGAYTVAADTTQYDSLFNQNNQAGWTLGQRWRLTQRTNVYNESQYLKDLRTGNALVHTFGMDFYPAENWNLGYSLQHGDLEATSGDVKRKAVSVYGGRTTPATNWQSKVEWREDSGSEERTQWVTTNTLRHKINDSWTLAAKANYSETRDHLLSEAGAKFAESSLGFAYRPWDNSRWGVFGRYTYVYDLSSLGQVGSNDITSSSAAYYDQQSHVASLEGVYRWTHRFETALKLADRVGKVRLGRDQGQWFDSDTMFTAIQARYEIINSWHALGEYRWLNVQDDGNKQGVLIGLDKDITQNFRVGVGYNFTEFNGDLTRVDDYNNKGWFLNFVGYY
ncbi:hypothetical protein B9T25_12875 [Acinetobacter sp. ANC 4470]|uniref:hypothetical protein n=1 Tax=Acinetobacter sp. ANC 4470 TaxID=1977881 RepID=UPI000A3449BB|nr:hypothetical protein [Acinetobacter sp. ANC 4470]OTG64966.1 hypothetical protein B9T25_12875 [Acinetobacter sp. ANC 4470]